MGVAAPSTTHRSSDEVAAVRATNTTSSSALPPPLPPPVGRVADANASAGVATQPPPLTSLDAADSASVRAAAAPANTGSGGDDSKTSARLERRNSHVSSKPHYITTALSTPGLTLWTSNVTGSQYIANESGHQVRIHKVLPPGFRGVAPPLRLPPPQGWLALQVRALRCGHHAFAHRLRQVTSCTLLLCVHLIVCAEVGN